MQGYDAGLLTKDKYVYDYYMGEYFRLPVLACGFAGGLI
jgi:hypothetical protein